MRSLESIIEANKGNAEQEHGRPRGRPALNSSLIDWQRQETKAEIARIVAKRSPVFVREED